MWAASLQWLTQNQATIEGEHIEDNAQASAVFVGPGISSSKKAKPPQIILSPAGFVLKDFLEGADGENLARAMEMDGDAPTVGVFEKTGCTFASCQGEPIALQRGHNPAHRETAKLCIVDGHASQTVTARSGSSLVWT